MTTETPFSLILFRAPNDANGNPRGLLIAFDSDGQPALFTDPGYAGENSAQAALSLAAKGNVSRAYVSVYVSIGELRRLSKWAHRAGEVVHGW